MSEIERSVIYSCCGEDNGFAIGVSEAPFIEYVGILNECLTLRVQCLNFDEGVLTVHDGKGRKSRWDFC